MERPYSFLLAFSEFSIEFSLDFVAMSLRKVRWQGTYIAEETTQIPLNGRCRDACACSPPAKRETRIRTVEQCGSGPGVPPG